MIGTFDELISAAKKGPRKRIAVPVSGRTDLDLIGKASFAGMIQPVFIGDPNQIEGALATSGLGKMNLEIVEARDSAAIDAAVSLVREKRADILMQGAADRNRFLAAVLDPGKGLVSRKFASYVSVFQLLKSNKLILTTDTFLNDCPGLAEKQCILENAIELAAVLGIGAPKVSVLAAIEQVNPGIPSTLDAAILSKMSDRKQFGKAIVEGPLDIDCSLSHVAAERKGLKSVVTGNVDIYLVPEVDTGYLLAEMLVFFGKMRTAGMVVGTMCPVLLDLPFVSSENKFAEIALACVASGNGG